MLCIYSQWNARVNFSQFICVNGWTRCIWDWMWKCAIISNFSSRRIHSELRFTQQSRHDTIQQDTHSSSYTKTLNYSPRKININSIEYEKLRTFGYQFQWSVNNIKYETVARRCKIFSKSDMQTMKNPKFLTSNGFLIKNFICGRSKRLWLSSDELFTFTLQTKLKHFSKFSFLSLYVVNSSAFSINLISKLTRNILAIGIFENCS